jgi:hypothetical protein
MKRSIITLFTISLFVLLFVAGRLAAEDDIISVTQKLFVPAVYRPAPPPPPPPPSPTPPSSPGACQTIVNPGQSIQAAINSAPSGHIICVRAGTYHEQIEFKPPDSGLTVMAYPGERPILDGQGTIPSTNLQFFPGLVHIMASNVTVDGFEVRNSAFRGVVVYQPSTTTTRMENVTVRNMIVTGSRDMGITVRGYGGIKPRNIVIANNVVHRNMLKYLSGETGGAGMAFVEVEYSIGRGNHVFNNYGEGLIAGRWSSNLTLEDNIIYDNTHANLYLINTQNPLVQRNLVFCSDDTEFWHGEGNNAGPAEGLQVRDEIFTNSQPPPSSGQVIINNIVVGCGSNFGVGSQIPGGGLNNALVANNSFINSRAATGQNVSNVKLEGRASFKNSQFVNNLILQQTPGAIVSIVVALGTPDLSTFTLANNLYSSTPAFAWPTVEPGRLVVDPLIANPVMPVKGSLPDTNSYRIPANSPAVNAGKVVGQVTNDFFQQSRVGALDIGADESN